MSVVAGCLLMDGVLIAADTRITYTKRDGSQVYVDNAIKILPFAPGTALGYAGSIETASVLLQHLIGGRDRKRRRDPITLAHWIPRLLRAAYRRLPHDLQKDVAFMVAGSLAGRLTIVERARVAEIVLEAVTGGLHSLTGTLPLDILQCNTPYVALPDTCLGFLYALRNPDFAPRYCDPLSFRAIGTGQGVIEDVQRVHARVLFDNPGAPGWQVLWFRDAISGFVERNDIDTVGGLYPAIRVRGNEFQLLGQSTKKYKRGSSDIEADVTLSVESGRWVQRNGVNGRTVPLELPWDLLKDPERSIMFDDLDTRRWRKAEADGEP